MIDDSYCKKRILYNKYNFHSVHCEWDDWKEGDCSKTCGGGSRYDTRETKTDAVHGGNDCKGARIEEVSCNIQECPGKLFCR